MHAILQLLLSALSNNFTYEQIICFRKKNIAMETKPCQTKKKKKKEHKMC